jgi:hypothetical protein
LALQLAMGILGSLFGTAYAFTGGSKKMPATPPINASSSDEADFIKYAPNQPSLPWIRHLAGLSDMFIGSS